jgi:hypothetical protein
LRRLPPLLRSKPLLQPEPVSPELVLVDPELALRERARLEQVARLREVLDDTAAYVRTQAPSAASAEPVPATASSPSPSSSGAGSARRRLLVTALMCSLFVNGFLLADRLTRESHQSAAPAVSGARQTLARPSATVGVAGAVATRRSVERKLAASLVAKPAGKLPPRFLDPATGLVKNNIHIACRRKRSSSSFVCVVALPSERLTKNIYVRYRARGNGEGSFTWHVGRKR